jgi:hypothetical protein
VFCGGALHIEASGEAGNSGQYDLAEETAGNCRANPNMPTRSIKPRPPTSARPLLLNADWLVVHAIVRS